MQKHTSATADVVSNIIFLLFFSIPLNFFFYENEKDKTESTPSTVSDPGRPVTVKQFLTSPLAVTPRFLHVPSTSH